MGFRNSRGGEDARGSTYDNAIISSSDFPPPGWHDATHHYECSTEPTAVDNVTNDVCLKDQEIYNKIAVNNI